MIGILPEFFSKLINSHPVLLLSSRSGRNNTLSPLTWYTPVSCDPPMIGISLKPSSTSYHYIRESGDFICAIPDETHLKIIHFCGVHSGRDMDKFRYMNMTTSRGKAVSPLYLSNCLANIECRVRDIVMTGNRPFVTGEILAVNVDPRYFDEEWHPETRLVYHMGGNQYRCGNEIFDMKDIRPGYTPPESFG